MVRSACASAITSLGSPSVAPPKPRRVTLTPVRPSGRVSNGSMRKSSEQEDALAGSLGVEQLVGLVGLVEGPALGEQALDVDAAVSDEACALALDHRGEGPGADHRQLLPDHVAANVERDAAALAD